MAEIFYTNIIICFGWYIVLMPFYKQITKEYKIMPGEYFTTIPIMIALYLFYYYTYIFVLVSEHSIYNAGWSPYTFGGMPEWAVGKSGIIWYNHIWVIMNFTLDLFMNLIKLNILTYSFIALMVVAYRWVKNSGIAFILCVVLFWFMILSLEV